MPASWAGDMQNVLAIWNSQLLRAILTLDNNFILIGCMVYLIHIKIPILCQFSSLLVSLLKRVVAPPSCDRDLAAVNEAVE